MTSNQDTVAAIQHRVLNMPDMTSRDASLLLMLFQLSLFAADIAQSLDANQLGGSAEKMEEMVQRMEAIRTHFSDDKRLGEALTELVRFWRVTADFLSQEAK